MIRRFFLYLTAVCLVSQSFAFVDPVAVREPAQEQGTSLENMPAAQKPAQQLIPGRYINNQAVGQAVKQGAPAPQDGAKKQDGAKVENNIVAVRSYFFGDKGEDPNSKISLQFGGNDSVYTFSGDGRSLSGPVKQELMRQNSESAKKDVAEGKASGPTRVMDMLEGRATGNITVSVTIKPDGSKAINVNKIDLKTVGGAATPIELARDFVTGPYSSESQRNGVTPVGDKNTTTTFAFKGSADTLSSDAKSTLRSAVKMENVDPKQLDPKVIVTDNNSSLETRLVKVLDHQQPGVVTVAIKVDPATKVVTVKLDKVTVDVPAGQGRAAGGDPKQLAAKLVDPITNHLSDARKTLDMPSTKRTDNNLGRAANELKQATVEISNLLNRPAITDQVKKDVNKTLVDASVKLNKSGTDANTLKDVRRDLAQVRDSLRDTFEEWYRK